MVFGVTRRWLRSARGSRRTRAANTARAAHGGVWGWCGGARRPRAAGRGARCLWWRTCGPSAGAVREHAGRSDIAAAATRRGSCPTVGRRRSPLVTTVARVLEPHRLLGFWNPTGRSTPRWVERQPARPPAAFIIQTDRRAASAGPGHGVLPPAPRCFPPSRPACRGRFAVSSSVCFSRACPSTCSTRVASRTIAQGYRSHRWAWAGWPHQPCRSGSWPCRRRSGMSGPCRDAASSDTNVRNTSAGRGPTGPDDMTGPPSKRRTECLYSSRVPMMRPPTLLPLRAD